MSSGPKNQLVLDKIEAARKKAHDDHVERYHLRDTPKSVGEWRTAPSSREYVRRGHAWALLAWYHHEVIRPSLGIRAWLARKWWWITGQKAKLMSPWEQLSRRMELEARIAAEEAGREVADRELPRIEINP